MNVRELTRSQLDELKQNYLMDHRMDATDGSSPSYGELAEASKTISDEEIFFAYDGVEFSSDDFLSSKANEDATSESCQRFLKFMDAYEKGIKSVAEEDALGQLVMEMPEKVKIFIGYFTTDTCGNVHNEKLCLQKAANGMWFVWDHWFFERGEYISDKLARHSLLIAASYRIRSLTAEVAEKAV